MTRWLPLLAPAGILVTAANKLALNAALNRHFPLVVAGVLALHAAAYGLGWLLPWLAGASPTACRIASIQVRTAPVPPGLSASLARHASARSNTCVGVALRATIAGWRAQPSCGLCPGAEPAGRPGPARVLAGHRALRCLHLGAKRGGQRAGGLVDQQRRTGGFHQQAGDAAAQPSRQACPLMMMMMMMIRPGCFSMRVLTHDHRCICAMLLLENLGQRCGSAASCAAHARSG